MGKNPCYIIHLLRTKGKGDSIYELLSVIEDIKNSFVSSNMYGVDKTIMMDPTFVIVFSNTPLSYNSLSADRWELYTLTDDIDMEPVKNFSIGEKKNEDLEGIKRS